MTETPKPLPEPEALAAALAALRGHSRAATMRMLTSLEKHLDDERAARQVQRYGDLEPVEWDLVEGAYPDEVDTHDTRAECIDNMIGHPWDICELRGFAICRREFLVSIPTDDGTEVQSFATREEAQRFAREGREKEAVS